MIDIRKLKELVRLMVENELTELDLRDSEEQVTVRRPNAHSAPQIVSPSHQVMHQVHAPVGAPSGGAPSGESAGAAPVGEKEDANLIRIESPMVGTFYSSPNPDSAPFVSVGSTVQSDQVICIIEAMKIFNEIKAECSGTIHKVLAANGEPVEFGQTLFLVKPE